jgi:hypothetical protein
MNQYDYSPYQISSLARVDSLPKSPESGTLDDFGAPAGMSDASIMALFVLLQRRLYG